MFKSISTIWCLLRQMGRLMVGVHDYDHYLSVRRLRNPNAPVMSYKEFVERCQQQRFKGTGKCPC